MTVEGCGAVLQKACEPATSSTTDGVPTGFLNGNAFSADTSETNGTPLRDCQPLALFQTEQR